MSIFSRKKEVRTDKLEDLFVSSSLLEFNMTKEKAMQIPTVTACVNLIANTIAGLNVKLYKEVDGEVIEINNDNRISLLNNETNDIFDGFQFKKALIEDLLLEGNAYAYINKNRNTVKSLNYVNPKSI